MAKIVKNYTLTVLKPVNKDAIKDIRAIKQERVGMRIIPTDIMRLELGIGLIPLVNKDLRSNLPERIKRIRREIEEETGICMPIVHIVDNIELKEFEYSFYIRGKEMVKYEIKRNKYLCIDDGSVKNKVEGKEIKDPTFGLPAILINKNQIKEAADAGYTIADAPGIIAVNLKYLIKKEICKIFTYDNSKYILKKVSEKNPLLVEDCYLKLSHITIKKALTMILAETGNLLNIDEIMEMLLFYSKKEGVDDIEKIIKYVIIDNMEKNQEGALERFLKICGILKKIKENKLTKI
jgi:flagellar biosynthesis protein FlhA